jgi:hypothetical protein
MWNLCIILGLRKLFINQSVEWLYTGVFCVDNLSVCEVVI